jgi:outer membrane protein OmpA-like peptidoglycan-associated protein
MRFFIALLFTSILVYAIDCKQEVIDILRKDNFSLEHMKKVDQECDYRIVKVALNVAIAQNARRHKKYKKEQAVYIRAKSQMGDILREVSESDKRIYKHLDDFIVSQIDNRQQVEQKQQKIISVNEIKSKYLHEKSNFISKDAEQDFVSSLSGIPVNFRNDSFDIEPGYNMQQVKNIAQALQDYKNKHIYFTGFANTKGKSSHNWELSIKRAESLKKFLHTKYGFSNSKMHANGYGESAPICLNKSKIIQLADDEYTCNKEGSEDYKAGRRVVIRIEGEK